MKKSLLLKGGNKMKKTTMILSAMVLFACSSNIINAEQGDGKFIGTQRVEVQKQRVNTKRRENMSREEKWEASHKNARERSQER